MLEANSMGKVDCYADKTFAVHNDMQSHTGSCMTLEKNSDC